MNATTDRADPALVGKDPIAVKGQVREFWTRNLCGARWSQQELGTPEFFAEVDEQRYALEWHIPTTVRFERYAGKRVLEIGCGLGADGSRFAGAGADYTGIDLTSRAVEMCRRRFEIAGLKGRFEVGDAESLGFRDNTFDLVYSVGVLHHTPDMRAAMREILRVLKPGGTALLMVYHRNSWNYYGNIRMLRRYGVMLLRFGFGPRLVHWLTGEPVDRLEEHRRLLLTQPGYLGSQDFLNNNTDGPGNPLARVFSSREMRRMMGDAGFENARCQVRFLHKRWLPILGRLLPRAIEARIAKRIGWHLYTWADKPRRVPAAVSPERMIENETILCFAGEDWWYHHPHSRNHIMKRLARRNHVMFVNSIAMGPPSLQRGDFFSKIYRKSRSYLKWKRTTPEGLVVMSPLTIPFHGSQRIRRINSRLLMAQLGHVLHGWKDPRPILWITVPSALDVVGRFNEKLLVYHVSDRYDVNDKDGAVPLDIIRAWHTELIERADLVLYSGRRLFEEATLGREKSRFLPQAVDFEHFASATGVSHERPRDMEGIKGPILGYFGICDYEVDQKLVQYVHQKRPSWSWVFIGRKTGEFHVDRLESVHYLGPKPYDQLPSYAAHFDACVLPWVTDNLFVSYGSAIKVREYLATGKPVVITPLQEYEPFDGILSIARDYDQFIEKVEQALESDTPEAKLRRQESVQNQTWDVRAVEVSEMLREAMERKGSCQ